MLFTFGQERKKINSLLRWIDKEQWVKYVIYILHFFFKNDDILPIALWRKIWIFLEKKILQFLKYIWFGKLKKNHGQKNALLGAVTY